MARFGTGRPCLDLLATAHPAERLDSADALRAWIGGSSLVPPGTVLDHVDHAWLTGFRDLRAHTARLVRDRLTATAHPDAIALARVNDLARAAPPAPRALATD
ncbi:ABATE domain-containing protein, partial [Streptomyces sp. TRM76130]|nr:ABATE domain-containing protein [Streptomyces sp. TRM76130]